MHALRLQGREIAALQGIGARVMLLAPGADTTLEGIVAGAGGRIDRETETYAALSALIDDPAGWDLFVMACDGFGGLADGLRAHRMLAGAGPGLPTILIAAACTPHVLPDDRRAPVLLRGPATPAALQAGMAHALRDRLVWTAR